MPTSAGLLQSPWENGGMRWKNARQSQNVDDRRGKRSGKVMGGGIGAIIMALIAIFILKQDPAAVLEQTMSASSGGAQQATDYVPTAEEEELAAFTRTVLAFTEDVWKNIYPQMARKYRGSRPQYEEPVLVLFSGVTPTACGTGQAAMGPFYCPGDNQVYIDLSFFDELDKKFEAPGDFAQAYVIAHEVGHHIQNLLGISRQVQSQRQRLSKEAYNRLSVKLELQADYLAGVWAHHTQRQFKVLQRGDIAEGIQAAMAVGDDTIQRRATGRIVPENFTHGTSEQRIRWFTMGLKSGDPVAHSPFEMDDGQL